MIRSLNLAYTLPYPARNGYDLRVWNICRCLSNRLRQTLLCRHQIPPESGYDNLFQENGIELRSLHLPAPGKARKCVKALRFLFSPYPVMAAGWMFPDLQRALSDLLKRGSFDIAVMEGIWLASYWPLIKRSGALAVLNHFDLEANSLRRQASVMKPGLLRALYLHDAKRMQKIENWITREADWIWVTSEHEKQILMDQNPALPIGVAPNGVDCESKTPLPPVSSRELLFVGCMNHYPNVDAVKYFVTQVFPLLRQVVPDAVFRIVGRGTGSAIREYGKIPGVIVTGEVADLLPYYNRCAACVVPLRSGGGTRLKILECMAYGRPVVSTSLGAEGIEIEDGLHFLKADTPLAIVEAIRKIMTDPIFTGELVRQARLKIQEKYSWVTIAETMNTRYCNLLNRKLTGKITQ
jgi:glycosyltransferase involved in cell wall biosynthesis